MTNQAKKLHQVTQGYVDLATQVKQDADKRKEEVDKIIQNTEKNHQ